MNIRLLFLKMCAYQNEYFLQKLINSLKASGFFVMMKSSSHITNMAIRVAQINKRANIARIQIISS